MNFLTPEKPRRDTLWRPVGNLFLTQGSQNSSLWILIDWLPSHCQFISDFGRKKLSVTEVNLAGSFIFCFFFVCFWLVGWFLHEHDPTAAESLTEGMVNKHIEQGRIHFQNFLIREFSSYCPKQAKPILWCCETRLKGQGIRPVTRYMSSETNTIFALRNRTPRPFLFLCALEDSSLFLPSSLIFFFPVFPDFSQSPIFSFSYLISITYMHYNILKIHSWIIKNPNIC